MSSALPAISPEILSETIFFVRELVGINSFTKNPEGVEKNADRIFRQFSPLGFSQQRIPCKEPGTGNHLILDSGGPGPVIAMIGHLDTVFPSEEEIQNDFHWKQDGDRATGPGVIDIKGGTGMTWLTLTRLRGLAVKKKTGPAISGHQLKKVGTTADRKTKDFLERGSWVGLVRAD